MAALIVILVVSIFMVCVGWHNLSYYDELVPRSGGCTEQGIPIVHFPVELTMEEKLILRYKIYFLIIGLIGVIYSV